MSMIHIVGAGLAGLAAAVRLRTEGAPVALYEAAPQAGGRCRSYRDPLLGREIDNGNHLLLAANTQARAFIGQIGAQPYWRSLEEVPFIDTESGAGWALKPPAFLPKLPLAGYAPLLRLLRAGEETTLAALYPHEGLLYRRFLAPLCLAMLNTQPEHASARLFARVLWRARGGGASPLIATASLQSALIDPALNYLKTGGADMYYRKRLTALETGGGAVTALRFGEQQRRSIAPGDRVILALPASEAARLVPDLCAPDTFEPILNGHFLCPLPGPRPPLSGLVGGVAEWVFVRDGMIATTTSAASRYGGQSQEELAETLWRDVQTALDFAAPLPAHRLITEKRATFAATPAQLARRPEMRTALVNLLLAGDYTDTGLPATIEGAVLSGFRAAGACIS